MSPRNVWRSICDDPAPKMVLVLMVAEKPSLAKSLAEILSHKTARSRRSSCSACSVHEYEGYLPLPAGGTLPAKFKMTSVCGHVLSLDFQPKYNNWDETDPVSRWPVSAWVIFPASYTTRWTCTRPVL